MPVIIDPRRHDAVLFDLDNLPGDAMSVLRRQLRDTGLPSGDVAGRPRPPHSSRPPTGWECTRAGAWSSQRPRRRGGRPAGGFALVVGVGADAEELRRNGADAVVTGLGDISVRTGDRRMSELPDGLRALDALAARRPAVFFDFDGTLSEIVDDPDAAQLTAGAAEALRLLTAQCPVAVLSGRDLADVRQRIGLPGIWYAGSHGFELTGPDGEHHQNDEAAATIPVLQRAAAELGEQLHHIPELWWNTSDSVSPCTTETRPATGSARCWPPCVPPASAACYG
ncbi:trehalose-phosphatase [Mycobacterium xenopi 4042]|uniref:Trehalose 6-phosphate phosphatase n=1 Tax=Mycobacterium xenopi 4042 TaxID=1299334 RepID=X7YIZ4_MYCXE|nr:trehalose-phosphatase [Mycobacterium xenopi 4042]